jgi:PAS domain S-box-containing protein
MAARAAQAYAGLGERMSLDLEDLQAAWLQLRSHVDQLAGERQQYLDFFEQSAEAYIVTDADGTIIDANGAATDIVQRRRAFLRGKPFAVLVALDRRADFRSRLKRLVARESGAHGKWTTVLEAPELRTEVTLTARLIDRPGDVGGICWLIQAVE